MLEQLQQHYELTAYHVFQVATKQIAGDSPILDLMAGDMFQRDYIICY